MAKKKEIPKYRAIRIFLVPLMLYFLLVLPIGGIMFLKNAPDIVNKYNALDEKDTVSDKETTADTVEITKIIDTSGGDTSLAEAIHDSILNNEGLHLSVGKGHQSVGFNFNGEKAGRGGKSDSKSITGWVILTGFIAGVAFNFPFRRYFRKKRRNKPVSEKLFSFCKKYLQYTPLINCLIFVAGFLVVHIQSIYTLHFTCFSDDLEHRLYNNWFYISLASSVLTVLFVYLWQKYRLEFKYIEHVYDRDTLRKNIYKTGKAHSLKLRLWLISMMTTVLPLVIVLYYAFMSVSTVKDLGLTSISKEQVHILFGKFYSLLGQSDLNLSTDIKDFQDFHFVSVIDVYLAFTGMITSVVAAVIYIFFMVNWTNKSITLPVRDLMLNLKKTGEGELNLYIPVRTNDEMGALTEGYNDMTQKIGNFIEEISAMNRDLEQKVIERTREVVHQKEEIETQRDEILEKNEELVQQKEEIISQKDEIERQKKVVDDQNTNITDSIRYALRIQRTILPADDQMKALLPGCFIFNKPKDIVSGDFYWLAEKNNIIYFAAIDCTGHGVPGALMSIVAHNLLNQALQVEPIEKPSEILDYISREIVKNLRGYDNESGVNDGMDLVVCAMDKKQMTLRFAGVHNPLYIISKRNFHIYRTDAVALGDFEDESFTGYTNHEIQIYPGDMIYIFSDGFADQFGGANRKRYMTKKLRETLFEIHMLEPHEQKELLSRIFDYWRGNYEQTDDVLVFGLKI